jgi:hypothetical protein
MNKDIALYVLAGAVVLGGYLGYSADPVNVEVVGGNAGPEVYQDMIFYNKVNYHNDYASSSGISTALVGGNSGRVVSIGVTGATTTLPAVAEGRTVKVFTREAFATNHKVDSLEGDNITGTLIVNDAPVACAAEDQVNLVGSAESISDWVEFISDGTNWYILGSNFDLTGAATCTDPT